MEKHLNNNTKFRLGLSFLNLITDGLDQISIYEMDCSRYNGVSSVLDSCFVEIGEVSRTQDLLFRDLFHNNLCKVLC